MTAPTTALEVLSHKLCPWLESAYEQFDLARRGGRLGHAWIISGPEGTGKLNLALVLANRLLRGESAAIPTLLEPHEALTAMAERQAAADHHPDLHWLHPEEEKHTISVEQIRDVLGALALTAHGGRAKVLILEPADAMTTAAANALLKTLEEPSPDTYLLLLSHQPGRLPATIRSRCQRLTVAPPSPVALGAWLGAAPTMVADVWRLSGGAPLTSASLIARGEIRKNNELLSGLTAISEDKIAVPTVAETWAEGNTALALGWLTRQLHGEIRLRLGPSVSTPVTDRTGATLHNTCRDLPLRTLFDQYDGAEKLLNQLGSGINLELALQALLVGFQVNRGRS